MGSFYYKPDLMFDNIDIIMYNNITEDKIMFYSIVFILGKVFIRQ